MVNEFSYCLMCEMPLVQSGEGIWECICGASVASLSRVYFWRSLNDPTVEIADNENSWRVVDPMESDGG